MSNNISQYWEIVTIIPTSVKQNKYSNGFPTTMSISQGWENCGNIPRLVKQNKTSNDFPINIVISQYWEIILTYQYWYLDHFSNVGIPVNVPIISQYKTTDIPVLFQTWYFTFFHVFIK